jgi:TRAP transporter TAXI family solute receptor
MSSLPSLNLRLMGDGGMANFHIVMGWISANLRRRSAPGSEFLVHTSGGHRDAMKSVSAGRVDVAMTTPADIMLKWAREGKHFFEGTAYPRLQTLARLPHADRIVFAVHADKGLTSFTDLKNRHPALRIVTRRSGSPLRLVIDKMLMAHGIDPSEIEAWGGKWLVGGEPRLSIPWIARGEADAIIEEAVMVPQWHELVEKVPMRFIPMEEKPLRELEVTYGVQPGVLEKGRLKAPDNIRCIEWADWAVFVHEDLSDEIAYMITAVMVEERAELEARYRHFPWDISPLSYPIDPYSMWKGLGAPLHPGAERYYREHGYMS